MLNSINSISEFAAQAKTSMAANYPNLFIDTMEVSKMNQNLHGIIFRTEGAEAAPTLYVDDLFVRYTEGEDFDSLMVDLKDRYEETKEICPPAVDLRWEACRNNLQLRLLEESRNSDFLSNIPHINVGCGLVLTVDIVFDDWRVAVNYGVMEELAVDKEILFITARDNAMIVDPPVLTDMGQALFSPVKENLLDRAKPLKPMEIGGMFVLTTESSTLGASALFYPGVKEKAAEMIGCGYYVLPSSIHECILVPDTAHHNEKDLCDMVKQANRSVVEPHEVLSDNVFHYGEDGLRVIEG
ncbi:MAG: hypothetical protein J6D57_14775 [Mogibacterium sp.]|nr:hypothetical protein [Mogibacterium sp.]